MPQMISPISRRAEIDRWGVRLVTLAALLRPDVVLGGRNELCGRDADRRVRIRAWKLQSAQDAHTHSSHGTTTDPKTAVTALTALEEATVPDTDRVYCLDHLASGFASDDIKVYRGDPPAANLPARSVRTSTQLLSFVSSNSIDYTADIFRRIIRAIFGARLSAQGKHV